MFSNDHFLLRLSHQGGINPQAVGMPLQIADRAALGTTVMTTHVPNVAAYMDYVWSHHNILQSEIEDPNANPPYADIPTQVANPLAESMRDAFDEYTYYSQWHVDTAPAAEQAAIQAMIGEPVVPGFGCFHLIYALLIENTRCYEVMANLIKRFNDGESIGVTSAATRQWITTTEALFYRQQLAHDHLTYSTLTSDTRGDGRAIRRNAYYRMFGMDLSHGTDDNKPYPYQKAKASNKEFVATFEALLRELWVAITNVNNNQNVNPTDNAEIENLARRLRVMLQNRRINGTLTREEFSAVVTMDWIRLALSFNSPLVIDLRAEAESEYERLKKISERLGTPIHSKSDEYFELAGPTAGLLQGIENQTLFDTPTFLAYPPIDDIINDWSKVTGKVLKKMPRPVIQGAAA